MLIFLLIIITVHRLILSKNKIAGGTGSNGIKNVKTRVPLKYLSNFWRTLEMPLINC